MKVSPFCILVTTFIFAPAMVLAQTTAQITGTVTDPTGAAVAGAQVTVVSSEHGVTRTAPTNTSGDFLFAALPVGAYNMTVTAPGFKKYTANGIVLEVGEKARNNVQMQVGAAQEQVNVEGTNVAQVETQSSDLGGVVTGKEISQLELNGRNFTQLITLVPGVTNQTGQDEAQVGVGGSVAFSVNGGRTEYNNWEVDGGDNMDNGSNGTLNVYPSIDAIGEFKVLTSNYGAQYGRNGSGTVEVETKSGTSAFHGDVYEFVRNDAFNATPQFLTSTPAYKKNDFGYTIGGPIYIPGVYNTNKQKTFFFWSQEWRRDRVPATAFFTSTTVPTIAERGGNFNDVCPGTNCPIDPSTGLPFPGNQVPISDPVTVNALEAMIPTPNIGANQWFAAPTLPTNWREELLRVDHNFSDKLRGTFRYIHDSWVQDYPVPLWTSGTTFPTVQTNFDGPGVSMVARLTATISPTLLNEFVASYTTDHITTHLIGAWQRPANMPPIGIFNNGFGDRVPGISVSGGQYSFGEDPGYVPNGPLNSNPTYTFHDNVSKVVGGHNLQFGGYAVIAQKNEIPQPSYGTNGNLQFSTSSTVTTGNAFADLLQGRVGTFTQEKAAIKMYERYKIFEPYFQDDWHITKRLTLNLGLRLSFFGTYYEAHHNAWNWDPNHFVAGASGTTIDPSTGIVLATGNPENGWVDCGVTPGVPAGCMTNHWFNPAPRVGFAFDPKGDGKWAIRGGYGIFFEHTNGNEANTEGLEPFNPLTLTSSVTNQVGYSTITPGLLGTGGTTTTPLSFRSIPDKATWPYVQQWHLDVQHDIARNTVATLSYVGSAGVHLTRTFELNQMHPVAPGQNPYLPAQVISQADCNSVAIDQSTEQATATVNGVTQTGTWANNLAVACGNDPNMYRPFNGIGSIERNDLSASSNYNALQFALRHSIGGLQLNVAYTYSHSIDDSSDAFDSSFVNSYNLNAYRASSNFDQRHVFNLGYVWDLPIFKQKGLANKILGGWEWSGVTNIQSGTPFSVYNTGFGSIPSDNAGVGNGFASAGSFPDLVGDPRANVPNIAVEGAGPLEFNPSAFAAPTGLTFGSSTRNILTNPHRTNFDMALLKHFTITESRYFEFRAEAFNVFNHTEWGFIGGDSGSAASASVGNNGANEIGCYGAGNNAGDPTCTSGATLLHPVSVHNARILQLALKFIF
ncbi:MAG TPA: carboxypeptidase regulatory-like domain-containing protein [Terriglobales bacterium]|nr:carboxypeptidase regulatory-like domain-containing protein [Terriglobales bacterium]